MNTMKEPKTDTAEPVLKALFLRGRNSALLLRVFLYGMFAVSLYVTLPDIVRHSIGREDMSSAPTLLACASCDISGIGFKDIHIEAHAAYVYDIKEERVLFSKHAEAQLPLASLTKGMTALVVREHIPNDTSISISAEDLLVDGDSGLGLGERFLRDDLIDMMLSVSSNDGAYALARTVGEQGETKEDALEVFVRMMNEHARTLGLSQTFFLNPTGLDESVSLAGAYGSAHDMALLYTYLYAHHADVIESTTYPTIVVSSSSRVHTLHNTNIIAGNIPGLSGSKTGFTDLAGGNLVVIFEPEPLHPVVAVVLGSSVEGRFTDIATLVSAVTSFSPSDDIEADVHDVLR